MSSTPPPPPSSGDACSGDVDSDKENNQDEAISNLFVPASHLSGMSSPPLLTYNDDLDRVLGGPGVPRGSILEVCGVGGVGKSQFCLQLCVTVQMPAFLGGLSGRAVYLDTEGSFSASRLDQMAEATKKFVLQVGGGGAGNGSQMQSELESFSSRVLLDNVFCKRIESIEGLLETLQNLESDLIRRHPDIKLVILDSIAFPFRYLDDEAAATSLAAIESRTPVLYKVSRILNSLAANHGLAVVVTNQMTTRFGDGEEGALTPALGDAWAYLCSQRLILTVDPGGTGFRTAKMVKSPIVDVCSPGSESVFAITSEGLRDVEDSQRLQLLQPEPKRPRRV